MERNDKLKKIITKNRTCYYFDNMIKCEDLDINNISLDVVPNLCVLVLTK